MLARIILAALLFAATAKAQTGFTEFYCDPAGSNLNAGSSTATTALATYTSKIVAGGWDSSSGIFTVASGDPVADGVVTNTMWASVYVTSGATTNTFTARIEGVTTTTITVSLTAKAGSPPATDALGATTLKVGGAWKGPNGTVAFPLNYAANTLTNFNTSVSTNTLWPRINLKGGTTYSVSIAITHANAGPLRWQGYTTTVADGGKATIDWGANAVTPFVASCTDNDFRDFIFSNVGVASGNPVGVTSSGAGNNWTRCVFHDFRSAGLSFSANGVARECEAYACNLNNTASSGGFAATGNRTWFIRCISHDNTGSNTAGFFCTGAATVMSLFHCIADSNGKSGFIFINNAPDLMLNCDAYNNGDAGLDLQSTALAGYVIENCNFVKNTGWGITSTGSGAQLRHGIISSCNFGAGTEANGSGTISPSVCGMNTANINSFASNYNPWVDAPNGDFRLKANALVWQAGRGSFTETASGYAGTVGYPDVGAAQHQTPTISTISISQ